MFDSRDCPLSVVLLSSNNEHRITDKEDIMAPTQVTCPACKAALKLPEPAAPGRAIRCPMCKVVFRAAGVVPPPPVVVPRRPPPLPVAKILSPPPSTPSPAPRRGEGKNGQERGDRRKTARAPQGSGSRRVRLGPALVGGGALLLLVGGFLAIKLAGGEGEQSEKKDDPKVAQGDRAPG